MFMPRDLTIWLIDEGQTGHRVQSEGVIQALECVGLTLATEKISCQFRLRGPLRPPALALFTLLHAPHAMRFAKLVSPFSQPAGPLPDIIVSSGGRTAFASRALALQADAPNVFIGNPEPFPRRWFDVVMSPIPISTGDAIPTGVFPNLATPEQCAKQARAYWNGAPPNVCGHYLSAEQGVGITTMRPRTGAILRLVLTLSLFATASDGWSQLLGVPERRPKKFWRPIYYQRLLRILFFTEESRNP